MDITPPQHQDPASGDDELAKVLAGVSDDPKEKPKSAAEAAGLQFEETPVPGSQPSTVPVVPVEAPAEPAPSVSTIPPSEAVVDNTVAMPAAPVSSELESIKKSALEELRPLVNKLDLPPEEKFDTLLLVIRSTDDQSLLQAAHEAAKNITDETKRAQALLDVIKEVDFFANPQPH